MTSSYADDGEVWLIDQNLSYIQRKMQTAISTVEKWANAWEFKLSVPKTKVIHL